MRNTTQILLSHVKANLDKNLIDAKKFTPELNRHDLISEVINPAIDIFNEQANMH